MTQQQENLLHCRAATSAIDDTLTSAVHDTLTSVMHQTLTRIYNTREASNKSVVRAAVCHSGVAAPAHVPAETAKLGTALQRTATLQPN